MFEHFSGGGWLKPSLCALFFWGLWGFLTKLGAQKVPWQTMLIFFALGTLIIGLLARPTFSNFGMYHLIGLAAGIACAVGFMYFYIAIARGPASIVIPITSLYVVLASIMAFIFLSEPVSLKKIMGIICAIGAIALLAG